MALHGSAHLHSEWQSTRGALLLIVLLLLVLGAALAIAARTPWVLDQPMQPYDWASVL